MGANKEDENNWGYISNLKFSKQDQKYFEKHYLGKFDTQKPLTKEQLARAEDDLFSRFSDDFYELICKDPMAKSLLMQMVHNKMNPYEALEFALRDRLQLLGKINDLAKTATTTYIARNENS